MAIAIAAFVLLAVLSVAAWRISHPPSPSVPHLVGMPLSEVPATLEQSGIPPAGVTVLTRAVEPQYVGTVVDQQPQPGLPLNSDNAVQIAVGVPR